MISIPVFNQSGQEIEQIQVDEAKLGGEVRHALLKQAFVMFHEGSMVRSVVGAAAAVAGFGARIAFEVDETSTLRSFVAAGLGVSVLPRSMAASRSSPTG